MTDKPTHRDRLKGTLPPQEKAPPPTEKEAEEDVTEASCAAFGYLRGLREASASVEFRFRDGNSIWFPYGLMGPWQYNPSEGLLLKFSGDVGYMVLIRGSNLDKPLNEGAINLTNAGLQRHRVLWIREMTQEDVQRVGETGPTIDSIDVGEFTSQEERREWIKNNAPSFLAEMAE
jgi:hypothetical protein